MIIDHKEPGSGGSQRLPVITQFDFDTAGGEGAGEECAGPLMEVEFYGDEFGDRMDALPLISANGNVTCVI